MGYPGVGPEAVGIMAGVTMSPSFGDRVIEQAGPVVISHVASGAYLVAGDFAERRSAPVGSPGHGDVAICTDVTGMGTHNIGTVPGRVRSHPYAGKILFGACAVGIDSQLIGVNLHFAAASTNTGTIFNNLIIFTSFLPSINSPRIIFF